MSDEEMPDGADMMDDGEDDHGDFGGMGGGDDKLPEGVTKEVIKEAPEGNWKRPKSGDEVTVHYVGTLQSDGSEFDSSRGRGDPFKFTLGKGQVIKGWDLGVATMKQGEVAKFTLKPEFAYGEAGSPPKIPANATLVFEVELLSWVSKDDLFQDGGVVKEEVKEGSGWKKPKKGDEVKLSLEAQNAAGKVVLEKSGVDYVIGSEDFGSFARVVDKALEGMKKGEEVKLTCTADYAAGEQKDGTAVRLTLEQIYETKDVSFGKDHSIVKKQVVEGEGYDTPKDGWKVKIKVMQATDGTSPLPGFTPADLELVVGNGQVCDVLEFAIVEMKKGEQSLVTCTTPGLAVEEKLGLKTISAQKVVLTVELVEFEKGKDSWSMSEDEKVLWATVRKEVGSDLFRKGRITLASERYKKVVDMFQYIDNFTEDNKKRAKDLKKTCELNQAACQLKLKDFAGAKASCEKVLKEEHDSVKALFRRAQADFELKNFQDCIRDCKKVLVYDKQNRDAHKLLKDAQAGQKEEDLKSKGMFAKMCAGLGKGPIPPPGKTEAPENFGDEDEDDGDESPAAPAPSAAAAEDAAKEGDKPPDEKMPE